MKKKIVSILLLAMTATMAACGKQENTETQVESESESNAMSHAEYVAAAMDSEVVIEAYVQATQSWWEDKITVYAADEDGAYFIYNMACSEADAAKLTPGTGIRVTGYKTEWSGEVEIAEGASFEFIDGTYLVEAPLDVTGMLADTDSLIQHQNEFVSFTNMTVEARQDADGNDVPFQYNWDGSGEPGMDLYFNASVDGATYTFTVESYLCGQDTDVYKAVEGLKVGDTIDMEGFLYWYEGANPHITKVTVK